jgi:magnesium-transporting ATPase (P-type)
MNAFIEFYQLQKSEAILASFLAMIPPRCRVVRDGTISDVPAASLVKGDIVLLVCELSNIHLPRLDKGHHIACGRQDTGRPGPV